MVTYVEGQRQGFTFAVLDPPAGLTAAAMVTYTETTAALIGISSRAAIYWPRIKVLNPSKSVYGSTDTIVVPPAAWVCGVMSRTDRAREGGVYDPPAGIDQNRGVILGCLGFETDEVLDERKRDLVAPKLINPISRETGTPRFIDGEETLKADDNFPTVSERRGVIYIQRQLKQGTTFARHTNHDGALRARVFRTIFQFLKAQMNVNAFRTKDTQTAFFVDVSEALNPPSVVFARKVIARIGLATQKSAKWVILRFSQDTRALEEELAG
jgi:phage tail sheath protein FI